MEPTVKRNQPFSILSTFNCRFTIQDKNTMLRNKTVVQKYVFCFPQEINNSLTPTPLMQRIGIWKGSKKFAAALEFAPSTFLPVLPIRQKHRIRLIFWLEGKVVEEDERPVPTLIVNNLKKKVFQKDQELLRFNLRKKKNSVLMSIE